MDVDTSNIQTHIQNIVRKYGEDKINHIVMLLENYYTLSYDIKRLGNEKISNLPIRTSQAIQQIFDKEQEKQEIMKQITALSSQLSMFNELVQLCQINPTYYKQMTPAFIEGKLMDCGLDQESAELCSMGLIYHHLLKDPVLVANPKKIIEISTELEREYQAKLGDHLSPMPRLMSISKEEEKEIEHSLDQKLIMQNILAQYGLSIENFKDSFKGGRRRNYKEIFYDFCDSQSLDAMLSFLSLHNISPEIVYHYVDLISKRVNIKHVEEVYEALTKVNRKLDDLPLNALVLLQANPSDIYDYEKICKNYEVSIDEIHFSTFCYNANTVFNNLDLLSRYDVTYILENNQSILLSSSELLEAKLEVLKNYGYHQLHDQVNSSKYSYRILGYTYGMLVSILDKIIEKNRSFYFQQNPSLLLQNIELVLQLMDYFEEENLSFYDDTGSLNPIFYQTNYENSSYQEIYQTIRKTGFRKEEYLHIIEQQHNLSRYFKKLDEFYKKYDQYFDEITLNKDHMNQHQKCMLRMDEQYLSDEVDQVYIINGVRVSKEKLSRNLMILLDMANAKLDTALFSSILYEGMYDINQMQKLQEKIFGLEG